MDNQVTDSFPNILLILYNVKFGNKLVKSIPANMLEVKKQQEHKHEVDTGEDEEDE